MELPSHLDWQTAGEILLQESTGSFLSCSCTAVLLHHQDLAELLKKSTVAGNLYQSLHLDRQAELHPSCRKTSPSSASGNRSVLLPYPLAVAQ